MKILISFLLLVCYASALDCENVVVVILSQQNKYHLQLAENVRNDLLEQARSLQHEQPVIHLLHEDFPHAGGWTITPIIPKIYDLHKNNSSWIFFVEDRTKIRFKKLLETLSKYDHKKPIWIGHALNDEDATIIHHFAFHENPMSFKYPNIASGFAISIPLMQSLSDRQKVRMASGSDFSIDNSYELALFVWNKGMGHMLVHEPTLCIREESKCAATPTSFQVCGDLVPNSSIYFAVKTCSKYHHDRLSVVQDTWARHASRISFFSDVKDDSIPTLSLGIPNAEQGHCTKTLGILKHIAQAIRNDADVKWIVVADDDTILSVSRIQQLLSCYDASEPVALGERYGYNVDDMHYSRGYNYITGGGGMVFSRTLLELLVQPGVCECPSINTPDDMYLGLCLADLEVPVTHSPMFHQARPVDYAKGYLATNDAVSFHKHWMIDPVNVYNKWFSEDDDTLTNKHVIHYEL